MTIKASKNKKKQGRQHNERPLGQRQPMTPVEQQRAEAAFAALMRERTSHA